MVEKSEFNLETKSSEDGLAKKVLNLPSSSSTSISTNNGDMSILNNVVEWI